MKARVTDQGLVIPKEFLKGVNQVEIRQEGNLVLVIPHGFEDPLSELGTNPVSCNVPDASERLDNYLY